MKIEIKNAIMKMFSDDATVTDLCDTSENKNRASAIAKQ